MQRADGLEFRWGARERERLTRPENKEEKAPGADLEAGKAG
jgi:hypothetical protein